jgi:hypothetical protein
LEENSGQRGLAILTRLLAYSEKVFDLSLALSMVTDSRIRPQYPTIVGVKSSLFMCLGRLGSLNSLEQLKGQSGWLKENLKGGLPSADTLGRIFSCIDTDTLRQFNHHLYDCLKRNKALELQSHGLTAMVVDGHESHATYMRCCDLCLERTINKDTENEKIQYYHRNVTAQLIFRNFRFNLDAEAQLPGEDEIACAIRLLNRVIVSYPRAFDVVIADALYARSDFFNSVIGHKKDVLAVLKNERRDLMKDVDGLFAGKEPTCIFSDKNGSQIKCWDAEGFQSWPQVISPVRVVRTQETKKPVRRQLNDEFEQPPVSSWTWVTTLSRHRARTQVIVEIGHSRWSIENEGFNELVNHWHADHVYRHEPTAMLNFWLMTMIAYNLFEAFFIRNLKQEFRKRYSMLHVARMIMSELYAANSSGQPP